MTASTLQSCPAWCSSRPPTRSPATYPTTLSPDSPKLWMRRRAAPRPTTTTGHPASLRTTPRPNRSLLHVGPATRTAVRSALLVLNRLAINRSQIGATQ